MNYHSSASLLLGLLTSATLLGQTSRPTTPEAAQQVTSNPYGIVETADGQLIGLAGSLEVQFGVSSVTITPLLGPDAPQNMPLTIAPTKVLRGEHTVHEILARKTQRRGEEVIDFALGHGITERFVTRADGVKHSFFFEQRPAGDGDLAVRLSVDTLLTCDAIERAEQLRFSAGNLGAVHIGAVVGIDRNGQRADGYMRFDGDNLDLVLPAAFVDSAEYPLELDPIISGAITAGRSFSDTNPDIAYDNSNAVYVVVYESVASASDQDIWAQRITFDGIRLGNPILIDTNGYRSTKAQIGNCNSLNNFLVSWQENGTTGTWNIKCRSIDAATGNTSGIAQVATSSAQETDCDVGGDSYDSSPGTGLCLCVWDDSVAGIKSCVVRMQNNPPTTDTYQTVTPNANEPAITKDGRNAGVWFVVSVHDSGGVNRLGFQALSFSGALLGTETLSSFFTYPLRTPDIDGDAQSFTAVYANGNAGGTTINCNHGTWDGTSIQFATSSGSLVGPGTGIYPAISLMGSKYTVVWTNVFSSLPDRLFIRQLELDSTNTCGDIQLVSSAGTDYRFPALASRRSGGDSTSESGLLCYAPFNQSAGNNGLDARLYATFGSNPAIPVAGAAGCGVGGNIGTAGSFALGNHNFEVTLSGASPTASLGLFIANTSGGSVNAICGPTCGFVTPEITYSATIAGGAAQFPIDLPCQTAFLGFQLQAQWAVFDSQPGGCSLIPLLHFSDAIELTLGY